jgi:hypothetical protein
MSLESLIPVAEIVNALAVTLSLVVVIISIRQNTKAQRVASVQSLSAAIAAINVPAMESPALGNALSKAVKDWGSATRDERILAHFFLFSYFKLIETAWYQQQAGALEAEQWSGWERVMRSYYHAPGVRTVWWPHRRNAYSPAFQQYLEQSDRPTGVGALEDIFD